MKKLLIAFVLLLQQLNLMAQTSGNFIQNVNPLIGTRKMGTLWYGHADMNSGKRTATTYEALDAFFPEGFGFIGRFGRSEKIAGFRLFNVNETRH